MTGVAGLRKERVRSVIICKDREFKAKAVQMLNGAAFPAEKFTVDNVADAVDRINSDATALNLVIDGSMWSPDVLQSQLEELGNRLSNEQAKVLCYLDEAQENEEEI